MTEGIESVEYALALFGEDGPLGHVCERFGESAAEGLARRGERWFWTRAENLWNSARERVSKSGRTPKNPRVNAAISITRHGAAEERRDLREAYENVAARSMTEDHWDSTYEEYVATLSALQSGDISVLKYVLNETKPAPHEKLRVWRPRSVQDLMSYDEMTELEFLDVIDRLESSNLVQVSVFDIASSKRSARTMGDWTGTDQNSVDLSLFQVIVAPLGSALLKHTSELCSV